MKKISITAMLLVFLTTAYTQVYKGSGGAFSLGVQSLNSSGLPQISNVSPGFDEIGFNFGGYMYWQFNRFTVGIKGYGVGVRPVEEGDYRYNLSGGAILGEIGYKVLYREKNALYPFVGIGYGGVRYEVDDTRNLDLGSGSQEPILNSGVYSQGGLVYDAGIRWETFLFFEKDEPEAGLLGIEAGYQFATPNSDWNTKGGGNVIGVTDDYSFDGWFVKLTLGGFEGFFEK